MAIMKMKRLRLLAMRADREELLRLLQALGCVEVGEPALDLTDPAWSALARPDGAGLARAREDSARLTRALDILDRYAPGQKKGLFRPRPAIRREELFDETAYQAGLAAAEQAARELNLPPQEEVLMLLDLGYAAEDGKPLENHGLRRPLSETVVYR